MDESSKNIAIFSAYFAPHMGGVEQFSVSLAAELASLGHCVAVVTCAVSDAPEIESYEVPKADALDGPAGAYRVFRVPVLDIKGRLPLLRKGFRTSHAWRVFKSYRYDAVVVNTRFYPLSLAGAEFARSQGIKPIVIEHGSGLLTVNDPALDNALHAYEKLMTVRMKSYAPDFYGVSQRASRWLESFGIHAKGQIPNALDADAFRRLASSRNIKEEYGIPSDAPVVAFTGRLVQAKGAHILVQAASLLAQRGSKVQVVIAGDGPERQHLQAVLPSNAHLMGRLDRADVSALLLQSDVFCFPSCYPEGLPTALLEAAACGCYLITNAVGGVEEVVPDSRCGLVLDHADPAELCAAIEVVLENPSLMHAAAQRCRENVERTLTWRVSAQRVLQACNLA